MRDAFMTERLTRHVHCDFSLTIEAFGVCSGLRVGKARRGILGSGISLVQFRCAAAMNEGSRALPVVVCTPRVTQGIGFINK